MEWYGDLSACIEDIDGRYKVLVTISKGVGCGRNGQTCIGWCAGTRDKFLRNIRARFFRVEASRFRILGGSVTSITDKHVNSLSNS